VPFEQFAQLRRARPSPAVLGFYVVTFIRKASRRLRSTADRDALLRENRGRWRLLSVNTQVVLQKTA
jgi:hypothetical protein